MTRASIVALLALVAGMTPMVSALAGTLEAAEFALDNGMRFVVVPRPGMPTVEAGWVVDVGSANEERGSTGRAHLLEHMLFKGSRKIGSVDFEREAVLLDRLRSLEAQIAVLGTRRRDRQRAVELREQRDRVAAEADSLARLGAFSFEYSSRGASRLNANTAEDLTLYYVTLPAERLELWYWLESDRLAAPVFRELAKERAVVAEERRTRVESSPVGAAEETITAAFWRDGPYGRSTLGAPADVAAVTLSDLELFFETHYTADRLTAVLVGNVDPVQAERLARRYFARLPEGEASPLEPLPPMDGTGERRIEVECECPSQVRISYPTVELSHPDQFPLQGVAGLLNGRAGRLYRSLVLEQGIAFAAFARQTPRRRAGLLTITIESRDERPLEDLVAAWDRQLAALVAEPPDSDEWTRIRRRMTTDHLNALKDPHALMRRLLVYAGLGDWRLLGGWPDRMAAISPTQLRDAAARYLRPERRQIAFLGRGRGQEP